MPLSLDAVMIGTFQQILPAAAALIDKAEEHCNEQGIAPSDLIGASLAETMWPLGKQFEQVMHHSAMAIEGVRKGLFASQGDPVSGGFDELRGFIRKAQEVVASVGPGELESLADNDLTFSVPGRELPFVVRDFLLTMTLPNFYFHYTTAYDILRSRGLPLSKLDFIGSIGTKG